MSALVASSREQAEQTDDENPTPRTPFHIAVQQHREKFTTALPLYSALYARPVSKK